MHKKIFLSVAALFLVFQIFGQSTAGNGPLYQPCMYEEVLENRNKALQVKLDKTVQKNPYWKQLTTQKRLAVGLVDLSDPENVRYASINGDHMMYAASLPKIAVLLAATDALDKGELKMTPEIKRDMRQMIARSNNAATTRMIDRIGFKKIREVLTNQDLRLYDKNSGGGLWVGKRYGSGGPRIGDPIKNISHAASVDQVCRYYTMLAYGKLINEEQSAYMMSCLGEPELHHKFVNVLKQISPEAKIFRKSGSWRTWHADSALVYDGDKTYVLVALINDETGGQICKDLVYTAQEVLGTNENAKFASLK